MLHAFSLYWEIYTKRSSIWLMMITITSQPSSVWEFPQEAFEHLTLCWVKWIISYQMTQLISYQLLSATTLSKSTNDASLMMLPLTVYYMYTPTVGLLHYHSWLKAQVFWPASYARYGWLVSSYALLLTHQVLPAEKEQEQRWLNFESIGKRRLVNDSPNSIPLSTLYSPNRVHP